MNTYLGRVISNFKDFYNDINAATLTGAIDVIVVEQPDGSYNCSPFHVRFGKLGVLRSKEKVVDIEINGIPRDIHMKLGESGEAFFVEEIEESDGNEIPEHLATSPIPVSELETIMKSGRRRSLDLGQTTLVLENQENDYSKRRNTADNDTDPKTRERNFFKRQITLGNLEVENSADDITSSLQSNTKVSSEDLSKNNDISDTIFKMDSLDTDISKAESLAKSEEGKEEEGVPISFRSDDLNSTSESRGSKKKRRKMKKKNAPRKSSSTNQITVNITDNVEKISDSATEKSSLSSSNSSQLELKEAQKQEIREEDANISTQSASTVKKLDPEFHFFSDTELTSGNIDSRANTPVHIESVLSDSELEVNIRKEDQTSQEHSWEWGGFPSVSQAGATSPVAVSNDPHEQMSMLSTMFSFMKQNKRPLIEDTQGVYLSDISSGAVDPEVASIYFTANSQQRKQADADLDYESGNGPSLTQSPNSAEGSKSIDSDFDEQNRDLHSFGQDVALSLCGWDPVPDESRFAAHLVPFTDLCNNPLLLEDKNMVVRIHNKYYSWKVASVIFASLLVFRVPLPQSTIEQLYSTDIVSSQQKESQDSKNKESAGRYSWWSWRRTRRSTTPDAVTDKLPESKPSHIDAAADQFIIPGEVLEGVEKILDVGDAPNVKDIKDLPTPSSPPPEKYRKSLRLSSKQIEALNLREGMNEVEFSVTTAYQGTTRCKCYLYKWKWDDKIVISDIDGTITRSDVLGHILPIVGKDWAQSGVAQLFNKIRDNGYKLLYLSARAIGQARITRDYLKSIKQGDLTMPDGPVLLNPTSLITAFHREVIERKPEQFKISCMSDIKALFPLDSNPFYAGYGNRINDVWAYRAVGIPIVRIFTINHKGELKHELTQTFQSSYSSMSSYVDQLYPPIFEGADDYSQFVYWREPIPSFDDIKDKT